MSKVNSTPPNKRQRISIELGENEAEGFYSNMTMINVSGSEFVIDFARLMPGRTKAKVYSRIIMAPPNAKAFLKGLEQNLKKFEELHGVIGDPTGRDNIGFSTDEGAQGH